MPGIGIQIGRGRARSQILGAIGNVPSSVISIAPTSDWNGAAASGFITTPSDPVRTTAKPALQLMVPDAQRFTDRLVVGALAFANADGTLVGGVDRVRFTFEGTVADVVAPSFHTFTDANGVQRSYWGYWVELQKPASVSGVAQLYVEAIPADATMQSRVIGPFEFYPQDTLYDVQLTVTPSAAEVVGSNYQTLGAALSYYRDQQLDSVHIRVTETLTEDLHDTMTSGSGWSGQGYCVVEADAPVTIRKLAFEGDVEAQYRFALFRVCWRGQNITFDMQNIAELRVDEGQVGNMWLDGCRFVNSGGRGARWRGKGRPTSWLVRRAPYFTETIISDLPNVVTGASLARGVQATNIYGDFAGQQGMVVYNQIDNLDSVADWLRDLPAMDISYTGSEATATLAKSAGNVLTASYGSNTSTFNLNNSENRYDLVNAVGFDPLTENKGYWPSHVATWLNSLPGWSASVLNNASVATALSTPDERGGSFTAQNVKDVTLQLVSCFDFHGDFIQISNFASPTHENGIVAFNQGIDHRGQNFWVPGNTFVRDFVFVNNAISNIASTGNYGSYLEAGSALTNSPHSHVVFAHNTMPTQQLRLDGASDGYDPDAYCLVANNAIMGLSWEAGATVDPELTIKNNVIDSGQTFPSTATGGVIAGDYTSKFAGSLTGDFTPAGALLTNLKVPITPVGFSRTIPVIPSAVGAF